MKKQLTINDLVDNRATINGVVPSRVEWGVFLNYGEKAGVVKRVGSKKPAGGKGKPSTIWEIGSDFNVKFDN